DPSLPHTDLGPLLNAVFWTLTILALIFLLLRIHIKLSRATVSLWWDDHLLILSWMALAVSASTTSACVALDYGKHSYDLDPANLPKMPFIAVFAGFFSVLAAAWSKTSFALTLLRLAKSQENTTRGVTGNWMKWLIWAIIISVNAVLGVAMLTMWIKCWPIQKIWDATITEGWCIDPQKIIVLYQWSAGWSGAMDIVLALCPWVLLWKLTMTRRDKIGVAVAMSMGVVAGVASFVKMGMLPNLAGDPVDTVAVTIWGGAEGAITTMAASLPVLRTLFNRRKD
ncbi:96ca82bc-67f3-4b3a-ab36-ffe7d8f40fbe, partial [Rhypophila sp. PSN 637]